jgi:trans-aconitate 2-methyltransferase
MPMWDANQYLKFANERTQPARDLVSRILLEPQTIIDLGCGPGNSTEILNQRWANAALTGLDSSPEMLAQAKANHPDWTWLEADMATFSSTKKFDLVFSNAALQWVKNHAELLPRLKNLVADGGAIAIQIPAHQRSHLHQAMLEIAADPKWAVALEKASFALSLETPQFYYDCLLPATKIELWQTAYQHVLENAEAILEWIRGTGLRPFLEALPSDAARSEFEARLLERVRQAYPPQRDGKVLFEFNRLFMIAYK